MRPSLDPRGPLPEDGCEAQLARAQFALVLENVDDAFLDIDASFALTHLNSSAARLMGRDREELVGRQLVDVFPALRGHPDLQRIEVCMRERRTVAWESLSPFASVWVRARACPSPTGGVFVLLRDIDENRKAQAALLASEQRFRTLAVATSERERARLLAAEQLARLDAECANRMKDEFLARVSHELATPLLGMRLWVSTLRTAPQRLAEGLDALHHIERSQSKLVHDLLDTSRALGGSLCLSLASCDPAQPIEMAMRICAPLATKKGLALEAIIESTCKVNADTDRLQQVVSHLLLNAIKFTPEGGRVQVRVRVRNGGVAIVVRDTGRGFPLEFEPFLFAPFRQEEEGTTREQGGLGLGLAIVRHVMEAHGGTVTAESAGRDQGSTFTVWLPRPIPDKAATVATSSAGSSGFARCD